MHLYSGVWPCVPRGIYIIRSTNKFWMFAALSALIITMVLAGLFMNVWHSLTPEQQSITRIIAHDYFGYLFASAFLVLAGLGFGLDAIFHMYILPLNRLSEEISVIFSSNISYRLGTQMGGDLTNLAGIINQAADKYQELHTHVEEKIARAKQEAESEKDILAAIMAELPEGVLICNISGRIILYNRQAKQIFSRPMPSKTSLTASKPSEKYVGLGRSIFNIIDKNLIVHAINEAQDRLDQNMENTASYFISQASNKILYKVETAPILDKSRVITGFILIFKEITQDLLYFKTIDSVMEAYSGETQELLSEILAFMESDAGSPPVHKKVWQDFRDSIILRSKGIETRLQGLSCLFKEKMGSMWPVVSLPGDMLFEMLQKNAAIFHNIRLNVTGGDRQRRVQVEPYSFTAMGIDILQRINLALGCDEFDISCSADTDLAHLMLTWKGRQVTEEQLSQWLPEQLVTGEAYLPLTLQDALVLNNAELHLGDRIISPYISGLDITLKVKENPAKTAHAAPLIITTSRPEFYDFELFDRNRTHKGFQNMELTKLSYTVFDTETTGLDPDHGDEIISLAAVRIVNSKIQYNETFDQLIDPKRSVPLESVRIHGITKKMLTNKPTIDKILPGFFLFTEDTVLLGHNIAFDMKMLQKYEYLTGIKFNHPILDTLLLSAVTNPLQKYHTMEKLAERLGVNIMGRHTALGDSLATAEIFLRIVPLLNQKGIYTLKDAVAASRKTYYSRIKY